MSNALTTLTSKLAATLNMGDGTGLVDTMRRHYLRILRRWMIVVAGLLVWGYITNGWMA